MYGVSSTVRQQISALPIYQDFSYNVGFITMFKNTDETLNVSTSVNTPISISVGTQDQNLPSFLQTETNSASTTLNSILYSNLQNVTNSSNPTAAHGDRLVCDTQELTRYTSLSTGYLSNLYQNCKQLMYLTPCYTTYISYNSYNNPYFTSTIENNAVIVDKLGNKISTDYNWVEQVMLSAYNKE